MLNEIPHAMTVWPSFDSPEGAVNAVELWIHSYFASTPTVKCCVPPLGGTAVHSTLHRQTSRLPQPILLQFKETLFDESGDSFARTASPLIGLAGESAA